MRKAFAMLGCLAGLWWVSAAHADCQPSRLGRPCPVAGLAVAPRGQGMLDPTVGNPMHGVTGNKYQDDIDLPALSDAPDLELRRHYNSADLSNGPLGPGWRWSYDTRLYRVAGRHQLLQADGSRVDFDRDGRALDRAQGRLRPWRQGHRWDWPDGSRRWFDAQGHLVRLQRPGRPATRVRRHAEPGPLAGALREVDVGQGRRLQWHYGLASGRLVVRQVDTPLGSFHYDYDQAGDGRPRLVAVRQPGELIRRYHHEAVHQSGHAHALTGLSLTAGTGSWRARTWAYDRQGRVVRMEQHGYRPGEDTVIHWNDDGQTGVSVRGARGLPAPQTPAGAAPGAPALSRTMRPVAQGAYWGWAPADDSAAYRHDAAGRLAAVPGVALQWRGDHLAGVVVDLPGWPGLRWRYDDHGRRSVWQSDATGTETLDYDAQGRPLRRRSGGEVRQQVRYDRLGRPVSVSAIQGGQAVSAKLGWRRHRLIRVELPDVQESRLYDRLGRLHQRREQRRGPAGGWRRYVDTLHYDARHRLVRHDLPEGGALLYERDASGRLTAIQWRDAQGRVQAVVDSVPGRAGYRYGNGLRLVTAAGSRGATRLALLDTKGVRWRQQLWFDARGRVATERHDWPGLIAPQTLRHGYDDANRLVAWDDADGSAGEAATFYRWREDGWLAARRGADGRSAPDLSADASAGPPTHLDGWAWQPGPQGRPVYLRHDGGAQLQLRYDAHGRRIRREARTKDGARAVTDFLYLDQQRVAETDADGRVSVRYVYAGWTPVAMIRYEPRGPSLFFIHADLLGAPRLVTDEHGQARWAAAYTPFGRVTRRAGDLALALRLPGQWEDPLTGWHDNVWRDYLPDRGHYLTPDPLGPQPGSQAYGYADQQPRRYIDPLGLLLFAFDGTRHNPQVGGNVWALMQYYRDGPAFYQAGPGNPYYLDWDALTAWRAPQILDNQWQALLGALQRADASKPVPIDILGYSRGAALARHFAHQVAAHVSEGRFSHEAPGGGRLSICVDLRFLGLFDTVAQFGVGGWRDRQYDLTIAPAWAWVAHAVALHEHRALYPLVDAGDGGNLVQQPFIGAHADIGGGVLPLDGPPQSDLSDVALAWMWWQARAASVSLDALQAEHRDVASPVLRDFRSVAERTVVAGDRAVHRPDGSPGTPYQQAHATLGQQPRDEVEAFIMRADDWRSQPGDSVGLVDWASYHAWLGTL